MTISRVCTKPHHVESISPSSITTNSKSKPHLHSDKVAIHIHEYFDIISLPVTTDTYHTMADSYYTILAWTVVLGSSGFAYYYYNGKNGRQAQFRGRTARKDLSQAAAAVQPGSGSPRRKKQQNRPRPATTRDSHSPAVQSSPAPVVDDAPEKKENNAWAHELAKKKQGTSLKPVAHNATTRPRSVKQASANVRAEQLSTESSIVDGDDETSPVASPAHDAKAPSGRDVSDMLEATSSGPTVLKLTESTKKEKPKQAKAVIQQESKRDRQNRKKAEEKKAQREADEKERRILVEKQRKTAREARGEPAKNGLGNAAPPASNAWKSTNGTAPAPTPVNNTQLLDTFANDDTTTTGSTAPTSVSSSPNQRTDKKWFEQSLPSEEEQRRMLLEQDEESWTSVKPKAKKGSKQNNGGVTPVEVV